MPLIQPDKRGTAASPGTSEAISNSTVLQAKLQTLQRVIHDMGSVLVAFSGGIDSTLVLKVSKDILGEHAIGVTATSATLPAAELSLAQELGAEIGVRHLVIDTDQLQIDEFVRNDATRCYHCKTDLYSALEKLRYDLGMDVIVDGTNADDLTDDRPGLVAAREWKVRSPLLDARLSKEEVRSLAKQLGLRNWNKPAAACLSSRIPRGTPITKDNLSRVERAEAVLLQEGFRQCRVRDHEATARIEVSPEEFEGLHDQDKRARIVAAIKSIGFRIVTVDLEGYRRGSANAG
jgi:uncharacterized protein